MREFIVDTRTCLDEEGRRRTFRYCIVVDDIQSQGLCMENYGVMVTEEGGDSTLVRGITPCRARIDALAALLARNLVAPASLPDVIQDWL